MLLMRLCCLLEHSPSATFMGVSSSLNALLESIALTPRDHLILLGDLIDRGQSRRG